MAQLQFTYGGDPMAWIHMPDPLLRAYSEMRASVESERILGIYGATLAASGRLKESAAEEWLDSITESVGGGFAVRDKKKPRTPAQWKALGMKIEEEPVKRRPGDMPTGEVE